MSDNGALLYCRVHPIVGGALPLRGLVSCHTSCVSLAGCGDLICFQALRVFDRHHHVICGPSLDVNHARLEFRSLD